MWEDMSEDLSQRMPEGMSKRNVRRMPEGMWEDISEDMPEKMSKEMCVLRRLEWRNHPNIERPLLNSRRRRLQAPGRLGAPRH